MPLFVTIGYGDEAGYQRTPNGIRDAAHKNDEAIKPLSVAMGIAGKAVQVHNPEDSGVQTLTGPFMTSKLPVAGFAVIEAADLDEAIRLVSGSPCAVAHGVIEVWPLKDQV